MIVGKINPLNINLTFIDRLTFMRRTLKLFVLTFSTLYCQLKISLKQATLQKSDKRGYALHIHDRLWKVGLRRYFTKI